jgi:hypothetical protein
MSRIGEGVADASRAYVDELQDEDRDLLFASTVGVLRGSGRFLASLSQAIGDLADSVSRAERDADRDAVRGAAPEIDYERLADLVAARLNKPQGRRSGTSS